MPPTIDESRGIDVSAHVRGCRFRHFVQAFLRRGENRVGRSWTPIHEPSAARGVDEHNRRVIGRARLGRSAVQDEATARCGIEGTFQDNDPDECVRRNIAWVFDDLTDRPKNREECRPPASVTSREFDSAGLGDDAAGWRR
jgi:hypothetical protein